MNKKQKKCCKFFCNNIAIENSNYCEKHDPIYKIDYSCLMNVVGDKSSIKTIKIGEETGGFEFVESDDVVEID